MSSVSLTGLGLTDTSPPIISNTPQENNPGNKTNQQAHTPNFRWPLWLKYLTSDGNPITSGSPRGAHLPPRRHHPHPPPTVPSDRHHHHHRPTTSTQKRRRHREQNQPPTAKRSHSRPALPPPPPHNPPRPLPQPAPPGTGPPGPRARCASHTGNSHSHQFNRGSGLLLPRTFRPSNISRHFPPATAKRRQRQQRQGVHRASSRLELHLRRICVCGLSGGGVWWMGGYGRGGDGC